MLRDGWLWHFCDMVMPPEHTGAGIRRSLNDKPDRQFLAGPREEARTPAQRKSSTLSGEPRGRPTTLRWLFRCFETASLTGAVPCFKSVSDIDQTRRPE